MFDFLSTTQHKINAALVVALLLFGGLYAYRAISRQKADERVQLAATRAIRATAMDSARVRILQPQVDTLKAQIKKLQALQMKQGMQTLILFKRNENLTKQLDSVNAVLGMRPDF